MKAVALHAPSLAPPAASSPAASKIELREAARQFEAVFAQMMLSSMRTTSFGDDLMGDGGLYRDLYDAEMAKGMSAGRGLGIAELMVRQLQAAAGAEKAVGGLRMPERMGSVGQAMRQSSPVFDSPEAFVDSVRPYAEAAAEKLGVPVEFLLAQAALESGWGKRPAGSGNNLFGIKADPSWKGPSEVRTTHEFTDGVLKREQAPFRDYHSAAESFDDYVKFLHNNPRYREALAHGGDGEKFARGLQAAGYATDPGYAEKIIKLANSSPIQSRTHRGES